MRSSSRLAVAAALATGLGDGRAQAFEWVLADTPAGCEAPERFYSAAHAPAAMQPCCTRNPEHCPGGVACIAGSCAAPYGAVPCAPPAGLDAPNIVFFLNDDQGWCHWGFMGSGCGTSTTGTVIPAPLTPNADALALDPANQGRGRLFEISYSNAAWSAPAREALQLGLLRKDILDPNVPDRFTAHLIKQPDGPIYCSFGAGGKLGGSRSESSLGFDAYHPGRKWGRYACEPALCAPGCDDPPRCGPDLPDATPDNVRDVFRFIAATLIGPHAADGSLLPGVTYVQAQPFLVWISSSLPHGKHKPPIVIEDRFHLAPDYLFGESAASPGQPRFPFADPRYAAAFDLKLERDFGGLYGMIWWADDALRHLRSFLEGVQVVDHTGTAAVSLWERTVLLLTADNGADLPRAKRNFTENGYRNPLVIHDGRLPPSATPSRIEQELTHAIDVLPTIVDLAGHPVPPSPGVSLKPYLAASLPAVPLRTTLCGHETKGTKARTNRFLRVRPGAVGRCAPAAGPACATDADCAPDVCLLGTCGTGHLCLEDDDCPAGETCGLKTQKWCRFGRHPVTEALTIPPVDQQPTVPCTTDADCTAACPSSDPLYCSCEYREIKLYSLGEGTRRLMDLFVDPNEPGMDKKSRRSGPQPDDLPIAPGEAYAHLAARLACCTDRWWTPPPTSKGVVLGDPDCTVCEPVYACHRCGDGIVDSSEQCDGANLAGNTCATVGAGSGGTLACAGGCTFDTTGCTP